MKEGKGWEWKGRRAGAGGARRSEVRGGQPWPPTSMSGAGTRRHGHPDSAFGEGAACCVGAEVMLMLHTQVCPSAVASAGPGTLPFPWVLKGKPVGNCSPRENVFLAAPHPSGLWEGLTP